MKIVWLLSIIFSLLFAGQTQIVLSSYSNTKNATRAKNSVNDYINKNLKLKKIFIQNSLLVKYKEHGKYFRIVVEAFNDSDTLNIVLTKLRLKYKDAYVTRLSIKEVALRSIQSSKQKIEKKEIQKKSTKKRVVLEPKQKTQKDTNEENCRSCDDISIINGKILDNSVILMEEPDISEIGAKQAETSTDDVLAEEKIKSTETTNSKNSTSFNYYILLSIALFIALLYVLRQKSKSKKLDNHKEETLNEYIKEKDDVYQRMIKKNNERRESRQKDIYSDEAQVQNDKEEVKEELIAMKERVQELNYDALSSDEESKK